jgi:hypothetical protein
MVENSTGHKHREEIHSLVHSWLAEESWTIKELADLQAAWAMEAIDPANRIIVVAQRSKSLDQIVIQAAIGFTERDQQRFAQLPSQERTDFLWDLRFKLLQSGVLFDGMSEPLQRVVVTQRIYYDGLTKDAFLQRVTLILNALLLVLWTLARKFQEPPSAHPSMVH